MYETRHQIVREAGASGDITLPPGAQVLKIKAHASAGGATVAMPDGKGGTATVPIPNAAAWFEYEAFHLSFVGAKASHVVFTGTDGYFIEYTAPTGV